VTKVMAGIRSADVKLPPTPLPSPPLPTPLPVTTNPVQSLLEMMDAMLTLHLELQWVVNEQKATEKPTSQLEGLLELLLAPISISPTAGADAFHEPVTQPVPPLSTLVAAACGPVPRPLPLPASSTTGTTALCRPKIGRAPPLSAATASYVASRPSLLSTVAIHTHPVCMEPRLRRDRRRWRLDREKVPLSVCRLYEVSNFF
jgi:hypothetical protein